MHILAGFPLIANQTPGFPFFWESSFDDDDARLFKLSVEVLR